MYRIEKDEKNLPSQMSSVFDTHRALAIFPQPNTLKPGRLAISWRKMLEPYRDKWIYVVDVEKAMIDPRPGCVAANATEKCIFL